MVVDFLFNLLALVETLGDELNQFDHLYFGDPLFDHLRNWSSVIECIRKCVEGFSERVLFGYEDMYVLMIVKHIFEDDFISISDFKRPIDRPEVLKLFLEANILYLFCCLFFRQLPLTLFNLCHF